MEGSRTVDPAASMEAHVRRSPQPLGEPTAVWGGALWEGAETVEVSNWECEHPDHAISQL